MTRVSLFSLIAALAISAAAEAKPRKVSALAQPVEAGQVIQFQINVVDDHDIVWYKAWLEGQTEPSRRTMVPAHTNRNMYFGSASDALRFPAPAGNTRIFFQVSCVKNEVLSDSLPVTVRAPAPVPNVATKITAARYSGGTIEITFDGIAGSGAKIEADIWPIGGAGKRCIDQGLNPNSPNFAKNVSGFMLAPGPYQARVHLIRNGQLVHYADIHGIAK